MSETPEYSITVTSRMGQVEVSGPDANWVRDRAEWAISVLPQEGGRVGFTVIGGGTTPPEGASWQPPLFGLEVGT